MRDKRPVDELSVEELERVLAIRKREARQAQLQRLKREGRVVAPPPVMAKKPEGAQLPPELADAVEPVEKHFKSPPPMPDKVSPPTARTNGNGHSAPAFDDDVADFEPAPRRRRAPRNSRTRHFINGALLFVEVAAVVALLVLGANLLDARQDLITTTQREQQISQATRSASIPTLAPTPVLRVSVDDWVLPGGHTFVDGQPIVNVGELNDAGIPGHLLPEVQAKLIAPVVNRPPRTPETALALNIPALGIEQTIIQGTDWEALRNGVGQVLNGASPGDLTGNVALAAHNDIYGELFRHLDQLVPGDEFTIRTETGVYTYVITGAEIVEPTDVWVLENTGLPTATLISCYPYGINDKRYIVFAERVD